MGAAALAVAVTLVMAEVAAADAEEAAAKEAEEEIAPEVVTVSAEGPCT
ncbi:MAG: hypothetical protein QF351_02265 [Phycisphaerales bacterium]|nr:hypothetical protein [Phycisphaerales bacterium]